MSAWSVKFTLSRAALERTGGWKGLLEVEPFWEPATRPKFADLLPDNCVHDMTLQRVMADANSGERRALG